jgi:hypothetical protein
MKNRILFVIGGVLVTILVAIGGYVATFRDEIQFIRQHPAMFSAEYQTQHLKNINEALAYAPTHRATTQVVQSHRALIEEFLGYALDNAALLVAFDDKTQRVSYCAQNGLSCESYKTIITAARTSSADSLAILLTIWLKDSSDGAGIVTLTNGLIRMCQQYSDDPYRYCATFFGNDLYEKSIYDPDNHILTSVYGYAAFQAITEGAYTPSDFAMAVNAVYENKDLKSALLNELPAVLDLLRLPDEALRLVIQQPQQFARALAFAAEHPLMAAYALQGISDSEK